MLVSGAGCWLPLQFVVVPALSFVGTSFSFINLPRMKRFCTEHAHVKLEVVSDLATVVETLSTGGTGCPEHLFKVGACALVWSFFWHEEPAQYGFHLASFMVL